MLPLGVIFGPLRPVRGEQARIAVVPGVADQHLDGVGERHGGDLWFLDATILSWSP
jgi:hypothetical protein